MPIIWACALPPASYAVAGRAVTVPTQACPHCRHVLTRWGGYWRWMRTADQPDQPAPQRIWIRRGWCPSCRRAQALLPSFLFVQRLDVAAVIGAALTRAAAGDGARPIATDLDLPHTTVRAWWRRVRAGAQGLLGVLLTRATSLDPAPVDLQHDGAAAVLEALHATWQRTRQRLGARCPDRWALWSLISGGLALAPHTSPPFPTGPAAGSMDPSQ